MQPVNCNNCGAPMQPHSDGRQYHCGFCGVKAQVAIGADQIATGMALDMQNIDAFLAKLATSLQQAVPQQVRIHASGPQVHGIELTLEADAFVLRREGQHVVAQYKKLVRGIALKTKELPLQQWVQQLADALARHANVNAQAGQVAAMLGGIR
jgi:methyl coenzyme M reductase gamma subunit